jgi:hypothetical protein
VRRKPAIGAELSRQIERMMATDPANRPPTAAAAAEELRALVAAAGLGDPADELAAYFADPDAYTRHTVPIVVGKLAERARSARADGKLPRAIALIDRAAALAPDDPAIRTLVEELSTRRSNRWLVLAGLGTLATAVAAVMAFRTARARMAADGPDAAVDAGAAALAGAFDAAPAPDAPAIAMTAVDAAGPAPVAGVDARAGGRGDARVATVPRADAAATAVAVTGAPDAAAVTPPPSPPDAAIAVARTAITVAMDSWCNLAIDGTDYGRTDAKPRTIDVGAGDHDVTCVKSGVDGARWQRKVHVDAGKVVSVKGELLAKTAVTVATRAGLAIDGASYAKGGRATLTPGRHRITSGGKAFYVDIPRGAGCTLKDTDDPDHPVDCF